MLDCRMCIDVGSYIYIVTRSLKLVHTLVNTEIPFNQVVMLAIWHEFLLAKRKPLACMLVNLASPSLVGLPLF